MNQLRGLLRDTWWLWLLVVVIAGLQVYFVSAFFLVLLPIVLVVFVYMAYVRYDADGNAREL